MAIPEEAGVAAARRGLAVPLGDAPDEPIIVTAHDEGVAVLSYEDYVRMRRRRAAVGIRQIAESLRGRHINVQELLDESRQELEDRT